MYSDLSFKSRLPQNAAEAHRCRGADWTFDAHGLLELLTRIRAAPLSDDGADSDGHPPILAPSFDHALKVVSDAVLQFGPSFRPRDFSFCIFFDLQLDAVRLFL